MVRIILVFVGAVLLIALGVRSLIQPSANYLPIAGYFIAGAGLLFYGWQLRKNGKGNVIAIAIFIIGFILTIAGNYF
jgi:hypothetical protein